MNLIDIYRTVHPQTAEYTFFSSAHGIFSRRPQNKSQYILKDWNYTKYLLWLCETRNQLQKENWKKTQTPGD